MNRKEFVSFNAFQAKRFYLKNQNLFACSSFCPDDSVAAVSFFTKRNTMAENRERVRDILPDTTGISFCCVLYPASVLSNIFIITACFGTPTSQTPTSFSKFLSLLLISTIVCAFLSNLPYARKL